MTQLTRAAFLVWVLMLLSSVLLASCLAPSQLIENTPAPLHTTISIPGEPPAPTEPVISPTPFIPELTSTPSLVLPLIPVEAVIPSPIPPTIPAEPPVRFAVIGDFGSGDQNAEAVANLVLSWYPDLIITTGDNNYPNGEWETIDKNIGKFYLDFIQTDESQYGLGAETNRFFPSLGNHDWNTQDRDNRGPRPHLRYFHNLPGNGRYYDFIWGPVHFFAIDGDYREPDGVDKDSIQAAWLEDRLAASNSPWKVVFMHHPPYSSGHHGSISWIRWPFQEWGASVVLAGHDHSYERLVINGFPYFVNGLGGGARYAFKTPLEGSEVRFRDDWGAMLVGATAETMLFHFITVEGIIIDTYRLGFGDYDPLDHHLKLYLPLLLLEGTEQANIP
ncbi:MAG: metallophosphoesterase family protein [Anaerolineales bacterium]